MAKFFANLAIDYSLLDISGLQEAQDWGFDSDVNDSVNGVNYEDVVWFEEGPTAVGFGGTGFTMAGEVVTGGTVTGVFTEIWTGTDWTKDWILQGTDVSAVSLYNAALSSSTEDDFALVAQVLNGADTFQLSTGNDKMRGFGGNDRLFGNRGNDVLLGDAGNDTLVGGVGVDTLTGGAGRDVFDYNLENESRGAARDVITDFVRGIDKIDLSGIDANTVNAGNQGFTVFIRSGADFSRAGQMKVVNGVLYANTDADAAAEFSITLTGVNTLSLDDVLL